MKKLIVSLLTVALVLSVVAIGAASPNKPLVVGMTTITLQAEFFQEVSRGANDAAKKYGVTLLENDPQYDALRQVAAIENFLERKVDSIVVLAVDPIGIVPAVEDAVKAGTPVIAVDALVKSDKLTTFIGTENLEAGRQLGRWAAEYIKKHMGGKARIGIISAFNSPIQLDRQKGFTEEVTKLPGVKIVAVTDGKNVREEALAAGENLLLANPNLDLVYATGEPAVLGALAAARSQNAQNVKILGWDLTAESVQGIKDGVVLAMIQQNPYLEGYLAIETVVKLMRGEKIEKNIAVPVTIYTKDNIDQFGK